MCHGDQLSVERMVEAKLSMAFSEDPDDQLTGLIPRPQGFHKRCIILQDSMNLLFDGRSVGDKGSLCHIKNKFGFRTDDKIDRQTVFHELSEEVVRLAWPQVDKESIRQASTVADETLVPTDDQEDDHNSLEDTVLYWNDGHELEDTLPYYESEAGVQESGDSVFNYSRCVLWRGLLHMAQTDAPRLRNELIWNSTANLVGKPGHNIALDLVNEFSKP